MSVIFVSIQPTLEFTQTSWTVVSGFVLHV
jgi:hypothetical protein